ncbi:MAG: glutamine-hydrolyzing carbamoyl-phosphate synthase small subunit [Rikenellaceae bacterium]
MSKKSLSTLTLQNGKSFQGYAFGAPKSVFGETVFNTAMTGYPESLTDPSYSGQILVITYPLIGNYGVPPMEFTDGMLSFFESEKIHIKGLVILDYSFEYSHWNAAKSLDEWLKEHDIPAMYGVDTREITKILRESGSLSGELVNHDHPEIAERVEYGDVNFVELVSTKEVVRYGEGDKKVVLVDCGCKFNIIRCLTKRGVEVIRVPWDYDFTTLDYDGIMLSNGPGDPQKCGIVVENIKKAMEIGKPIFGICLGNQLLSIAAGATTYKLKYGHRSHNQPVLMSGSDKAFITSQNHGYAVDDKCLGDDWEVFFSNLNDGTNEGIRHKTKPFFSVQFHPEATSGPVDTEFLFDKFIELI